MPTVEHDNAPGQTVETTPPAAPEISDDAITSHPKYKELEGKHAAARKGLDQYAVENKKLKKLVVGDDAEEEAPSPKPATTQDLESVKQEIRWELKNEQQISFADKNGKYSEYVKQGKSREDALKLALYDEGFSNNAVASDGVRQVATSGPSPHIHRSEEAPIQLSSYAKTLGIKPDTVKEYRDYVEG